MGTSNVIIIKKLFLLAAAAVMLFACNKEDKVSVTKLGNHKFYATIEGTVPGTKIYAEKVYLYKKIK